VDITEAILNELTNVGAGFGIVIQSDRFQDEMEPLLPLEGSTYRHLGTAGNQETDGHIVVAEDSCNNVDDECLFLWIVAFVKTVDDKHSADWARNIDNSVFKEVQKWADKEVVGLCFE
jgi:hypothetical protein